MSNFRSILVLHSKNFNSLKYIDLFLFAFSLDEIPHIISAK